MSQPAVTAGARLRLDRRLGQSVVSTALALALGIGAVEGLARFAPHWLRTPEPSRLPSLPVLDKKLAILDGRDSFECILAGGTSVYRELDPQAVSRGYARRGGRPLPCFNLGVPGATAADTAEIIGLAALHRRGGVLVIGVTLVVPGDEVGALLDERAQQEPWLALHRGQPSLDGWLIDRSAAYRHVLGLRKKLFASLWGTGDQAQRERTESTLLRLTRSDGFLGPRAEPEPAVGHPAPTILLAVGNLAPLEELLARWGTGEVAVIAMPIHPRARESLRAAGAPLGRELAVLAERLRAAGALYLDPPEGLLAGAGDWQGPTRLSAAGVDRFGEWLGEALAEAAPHGAGFRPRPARPS